MQHEKYDSITLLSSSILMVLLFSSAICSFQFRHSWWSIPLDLGTADVIAYEDIVFELAILIQPLKTPKFLSIPLMMVDAISLGIMLVFPPRDDLLVTLLTVNKFLLFEYHNSNCLFSLASSKDYICKISSNLEIVQTLYVSNQSMVLLTSIILLIKCMVLCI